ncbi:MAG: hypothetical protein ACRDPY_06130 [Streptosporangiaceae bacterium]
MSKKTKPRRGPAPGRAASGRTDGADEAAAAAISQVLARLFTVIAAGDPLRAEVETSISLSLPRIVRIDPGQTEAFVSKVLVGEAVNERSPEGAALLRLLMTLGSAATKKAASQALSQLTTAGIYPPEWVTKAGKAVPVQAWRRYDVFGDSEAIAVTFRYGEAEHGIFAEVDLTGSPVAIAVGVALDAAALVEAVCREDDPLDRAEQIGLAEARARLESPLELSAGKSEPDLLSVDSIAALPIARSRVRRLPAEGAPRAQAFTAADRSAAVDDFMKSPPAGEVVAADEESTRFWAEVLTGYSSRNPGERPAQVGPRKLAYVLLQHVPNTFAVSAAQRQHLESAVTAWARWSAEYRGLDETSAARLTEGLPEVFGRFDSAYEDQIAGLSRAYLSDLARSDADLALLKGHLGRRMLALPRPIRPGARTVSDVSDPGERRELVRAEFEVCTPPGGMTSEEFVTAADRVVSELWDGDPPQTFEEAERLIEAGADRHDAIHTLAETR